MSWTVHRGPVPEVLREIPDGSVQCVVTSPPYWGLRAYTGEPGMIGLEPTLQEHLANLVSVFEEVKRVLRDDGTVWLNYGDCYAQGGRAKSSGEREKDAARAQEKDYDLGSWGSKRVDGSADRAAGTDKGSGLAPKQRLLMPARVALALQDAGWWIRSEIVWAKGVSFCPAYSGSCMPSSVKDRPTDSHEMVYLLTKRPRYFYDADAVREQGTYPAGTKAAKGSQERRDVGGVNARPPEYAVYSGTRNLRTVWTINPQGYKEAHFATFPEALVKPCILAGTSEKGACSECGAPWRRVVEAKGGSIGKAWHDHDDDLGIGAGQKGDRSTKDYSRTTTGWEPTCECRGCRPRDFPFSITPRC